jgi:hypothetical protein
MSWVGIERARNKMSVTSNEIPPMQQCYVVCRKVRKSFNDGVRLSWLDRPTRLEISMEVVLML